MREGGRRGGSRELIFISYWIEKRRRRHGERVILVAAQSLFDIARLKASSTSKSVSAARGRQRRPDPGCNPLRLDMKVQQGCNSSDMGIPVRTEEELRKNTVITPEDVLGLQKITESE